jgi:hypothetical protein
MTNHHIKFEVPRPKRPLGIERKPFLTSSKCDLDLWPFDPKINRDHLLDITNHHTKFKIPRPKRSLVIDRKPFLPPSQCDLDLWPLDPKINRGHLLIMTNNHSKFEVPRPKGSLVITRKPFGLRTHGPTDRQTDKCKSIYPLFFEVGA